MIDFKKRAEALVDLIYSDFDQIGGVDIERIKRELEIVYKEGQLDGLRELARRTNTKIPGQT